jgi:hypothetical protein
MGMFSALINGIFLTTAVLWAMEMQSRLGVYNAVFLYVIVLTLIVQTLRLE